MEETKQVLSYIRDVSAESKVTGANWIKLDEDSEFEHSARPIRHLWSLSSNAISFRARSASIRLESRSELHHRREFIMSVACQRVN